MPTNTEPNPLIRERVLRLLRELEKDQCTGTAINTARSLVVLTAALTYLVERTP
jgi:hypothetical protein